MGKGQYYHWKGAQGRGTGGLKRPYEIIILESRGVNILKKDYWTIFECSFEICGHEFSVKTDQFGCESFSNLVQCHDQSCLVER